jgi:hypothetical protein
MATNEGNTALAERVSEHIKTALRFSELCYRALKDLDVECSDDIATTLGQDLQGALHEALAALDFGEPEAEAGAEREASATAPDVPKASTVNLREPSAMLGTAINALEPGLLAIEGAARSLYEDGSLDNGAQGIAYLIRQQAEALQETLGLVKHVWSGMQS